MSRYREVLLGLTVVAAMAFGAQEAFASRSSIMTRDCGDWNWCAPSQGGEFNCDFCCGPLGGVCQTDWETEYQGCICNAG